MKPINKSLIEMIDDGYKVLEELPKSLRIYYKDKERIIYDCMNEQIIWKYESEINRKDTLL